MRSRITAVAAVAAAALAAASTAAADTMHPRLAARLSGMGEHGLVNFRSEAATGKLCWTFDLHTPGVTHASVRDTHGMVVARLGRTYSPKACAVVGKRALRLLESKPRGYVVWVDTKGHPGELRGKLFAGMAHM
jgi:hypothetical protein